MKQFRMTDREIDLFAVRDQFVVKRNKLNRMISNYEALVCEAVVKGDEKEANLNRQAFHALSHLRSDVEADINQIVTDLNRLAAERKSA